MGRHQRMGSSHGQPTAQVVALMVPDSGAPDLSDVAEERRSDLARFVPASMDCETADALRPWVVWSVSRVPFTSAHTDHKRVGAVYVLLADDWEGHGVVDPRKAFTYSRVQDHLQRRKAHGLKPNSLGSIRSNLYAVGRQIAPKGYPKVAVSSSRTIVRPAATAGVVRGLYDAAGRIRGVTGERLWVLLVLTTHAGARSRELTNLRGGDITQETHVGRLILFVRLVNPRTGRERFVPILDPVVASRLRQHATAVGAEGFLLGSGGNRKNTVNKIMEDARNRFGAPVSVTADQLRGFYITRLAESPIPTSLMMRLTDLGDSHSLYQYHQLMRVHDRAQQVAFMIGALR